MVRSRQRQDPHGWVLIRGWNATYKKQLRAVPRELFAIEKQHLRPLPVWVPEGYRLAALACGLAAASPSKYVLVTSYSSKS